MTSRGPAHTTATLQKGCLSPEKLTLKVGASVMFTKNSPRDGFVNGTLGTVTGFDTTFGYPLVKTREGKTIEVTPLDWTVKEGGVIRAKITQLPLRLAWAITVHKSQGMSLDAAIMDLSGVFEFGQGYVALSRVRRLSGLHMLGWNERAFQVHPEILEKDEMFREASAAAREAFRKMNPTELSKMHDQFISACGGSLKKGKEKKKAKEKKEKLSSNKKAGISTYDETLTLFKLGIGVSEIAASRGLADGTIISHIEKLYMDDKITQKEIAHIVPPHIRAHQAEIEKEFQKKSDGKLIPVFEKFKGKFSFDELRLVRMLL
jgi:hypothetical protein